MSTLKVALLSIKLTVAHMEPLRYLPIRPSGAASVSDTSPRPYFLSLGSQRLQVAAMVYEWALKEFEDHYLGVYACPIKPHEASLAFRLRVVGIYYARPARDLIF